MVIHFTQIILNLFLNLSLGILWNTIKSMNWTGMSSGDYQCRYLYIRWLSGWFRPTDPSRCASTWAGGWTPPQHGWQRVSGDPPLAADAPPDGSHTRPYNAIPYHTIPYHAIPYHTIVQCIPHYVFQWVHIETTLHAIISLDYHTIKYHHITVEAPPTKKRLSWRP